MARKGTNCRCSCGCTIWVPPAKGKNEDICRWCSGYTVFGKEIEPKHTGAPEAEVKGGNRPIPAKVVCARCRIPVLIRNGDLAHDNKYFMWDKAHEVVEVI